jgi:enoyl-CoA hydratase
MGVSSRPGGPGITVVTIDYPPVNALPVRGWFDLADAVTAAGRDSSTHVVVLRARGRGFCAGVDLKEVQHDNAIVGANHGCHAAFGAVYDCAVPVVAAVHGFCLGGGIGLVGNADVVLATDDATFGLPEVDRGALGAATHLARLVPQHLMRAMYYTAATATAAQLHHHGSVYRVVPPSELDSAALELAAGIAAKDPRVIRAAKAAINGIDPQDVHRSYRFEQGFTFELNLTGTSDDARLRFLEGR